MENILKKNKIKMNTRGNKFLSNDGRISKRIKEDFKPFLKSMFKGFILVKIKIPL